VSQDTLRRSWRTSSVRIFSYLAGAVHVSVNLTLTTKQEEITTTINDYFNYKIKLDEE